MSVLAIVNGRLGDDSELRTSQSGTKILKFSVAADVYENGEKKTEWYNCSWFGTRAEKMAQYLKKGQMVSVNGSQTHSEFQRKNGTTGYSNNIRVNDVDLMGGGQSAQQPAEKKPAPSFDDLNDSIDF